MKIAIDAMGGDYAPSVVVEGAIEAAEEFGVDIALVGKKEIIDQELNKFQANYSRIDVYDAKEVIDMYEPAAQSIRRKKGSSICVGIDLLKQKKVEAFVSAGNTGAVVCAAILNLGLLRGIERPGIAIVFPTIRGVSLIIDAGANIDPKPSHLLQYAVMSDAYFRNILNNPKPQIGILNIGEEETKGTEIIKDTRELLSKTRLNFTGNIEAKDIFSGKCDIILTDGFVGNIALKVSESFAEATGQFLIRELKRGFLGRFFMQILKNRLIRFKKGMDYSEYGGALLLGVDGIVIISHGRSSSKAIKNAIGVAKKEVERDVNDKIVEAFSN